MINLTHGDYLKEFADIQKPTMLLERVTHLHEYIDTGCGSRRIKQETLIKNGELQGAKIGPRQLFIFGDGG